MTTSSFIGYIARRRIEGVVFLLACSNRGNGLVAPANDIYEHCIMICGILCNLGLNFTISYLRNDF
jgi:hypothetical protein